MRPAPQFLSPIRTRQSWASCLHHSHILTMSASEDTSTLLNAGASGHQVREHSADGERASQAGGLWGGRAADAHHVQAQHLHRDPPLDGPGGHPGVALRRQGKTMHSSCLQECSLRPKASCNPVLMMRKLFTCHVKATLLSLSNMSLIVQCHSYSGTTVVMLGLVMCLFNMKRSCPG